MKDAWDMSLDFWETGPVRAMVEAEYATIVREEIVRYPGQNLSASALKKLHDVVVCSTFDFIVDAVSYGTPDGKPFTFRNKTVIREEVRRLTRLHLDEACGEPKTGQEPLAGLSFLDQLFPASGAN